MADIFVSYKRADAVRAGQIVALLEKEGWTVWWDTRLNAGERWDAIIEREIKAAHCVVVIWSPNSVDSAKAYWVHLEAHHGRQRDILVPITIAGVAPPFAFSLIQARDLTNWDGASREGAALGLIADVGRTLEGAGYALAPPKEPVLLSDPYAGTYTRISGDNGVDCADITITPVPGGFAAKPPYAVAGQAFWGLHRKNGPHMGEITFIAPMENSIIEHSEAHPWLDKRHVIRLKFETVERLRIEEENERGVHGANVSFTGDYERS